MAFVVSSGPRLTFGIARGQDKPWLIIRLRAVAKDRALLELEPIDQYTKTRERLTHNRKVLRRELSRRGFLDDVIDSIEEDGRKDAAAMAMPEGAGTDNEE